MHLHFFCFHWNSLEEPFLTWSQGALEPFWWHLSLACCYGGHGIWQNCDNDTAWCWGTCQVVKRKNLAKHLLTQWVPHSMALQIRNLWSSWSLCPAEGDVQKFLDDLHTKHNKLAAISVLIKEKDYCSTIIQLLHKYLTSFASGKLTTACLYSPTQTIGPDILIIKEAKCCNWKETQQAHSKPKSCSNDDSALAVTPGTSSSQGWGSGRGRQCGGNFRGCGHQCPPFWNCGSQSHFKSDCPKPEKQKTDWGSKN